MKQASYLEKNLNVLKVNSPVMHQGFLQAAPFSPLALTAEGVLWTRGLTASRIADGAEAEEKARQLASANPKILLMGAGEGNWVQAALEAGGHVIVWDRHPGSLGPMLEQHDLRPALREGRLQLCATVDVLEHASLPRLAHPQLKSVYASEITLLDRLDAPRALMVDGTLFVDDVSEALEDLGWGVFRWETGALAPEELERVARTVDARVVVAVNHIQGLAEACAHLGVPLVEWEIDPSTDHLVPATQGATATVLTWRRAHVPLYEAAGYRGAHLPLATNPRRRRPVSRNQGETSTYDVPLSYVGSSMRERGTELLNAFIRAFAHVYQDADGAESAAREIAQTTLELQRGAGRRYVVPEVLHHVAPDLHERFAHAGLTDRPDAMLGEAAAAEYRLRTLASLGPLGLHVWGDPGWQPLEAHGVTYRGWAGHFIELNHIYDSRAIHIDVGRLYQLDTVPMRVFDVLACGGFIIAEHSEDLASCFEIGVEIESWDSPEELEAKCRYYLEHPDAAREIAKRGRERVLRDHTIQARVARILSFAGVRAHGNNS